MTTQAQELLLRDAMNFYVSITEVYGAEKGIEMFTHLCENVCPELGQRVFFKMLEGQTRGRVTVRGLADPHDRVGCVREIRRLTGCGLKEAMDQLKQLAQGHEVVLELQGGAEVSRFLWPCYGENAYNFSYWNEDHDGFSINTIVRLDGMIVEVVEVCDYAGNRAYRWFNPATGAREAYIKAAPAHCENYRQAWDDVDFVELDVLDDFIAKAEAIRDGRDYDERVTMPIDISDADFASIARMAHDRDITFNEMVEHILREQIARTRQETANAAL